MEVMMTDYKYGSYELRPYQSEAYEAVANYIRTLPKLWKTQKTLTGAFIEASVGSGKTAIMGSVCHRFVEMGWPVLCLARDLKLVEQNSETFWDMRIKNSIYSAAYSKSMHYKDKGVIVSNEATAIRAIESGAWDEYSPKAIWLDENHQLPVDEPESQYMRIVSHLNEKCLKKHGHPVVLLGGSGSPYRGTMSIIGDVWKECLYSIDTATLVGMGFLVPTIYGAEVGHDKSLDYDLSKYGVKSENGTSDYSAAEMARMERDMLADKPKLQRICDEVVRLTKDRNAVMITGSGVKHLKEIAKHLPEGKSAIVHSGQAKKVNDAEIARIESGEAKYLLQIGCLTTGFDCPVIDTSVIMRRIGSLTLLVQLLGRGMRLLKPAHEERGLTKKDHLVLDYSGTLDEMMDMYDNAILDECRAKEDKANKRETQICPQCDAENSMAASRCIGRLKDGSRCDWFFNFIPCVDRRAPNGVLLSKGCGAKNSTKVKVCRCCNEWLDDPSENLNGQHYTKNDLIPVTNFTFGLTKAADKLIALYHLQNGKTAREIFDLSKLRTERWRVGQWCSFVDAHVSDKIAAKALKSCRDNRKALQYSEHVRTPVRVSHRVNDKNFDILARKEFE
jgi:superfamily II DNA or RNA helicase